MAYVFSNTELLNTVLTYGEYGQNALTDCGLYTERFPNRHNFIAVVRLGSKKENRGKYGTAVPADRFFFLWDI